VVRYKGATLPKAGILRTITHYGGKGFIKKTKKPLYYGIVLAIYGFHPESDVPPVPGNWGGDILRRGQEGKKYRGTN